MSVVVIVTRWSALHLLRNNGAGNRDEGFLDGHLARSVFEGDEFVRQRRLLARWRNVCVGSRILDQRRLRARSIERVERGAPKRELQSTRLFRRRMSHGYYKPIAARWLGNEQQGISGRDFVREEAAQVMAAGESWRLPKSALHQAAVAIGTRMN